ncbi:MAG: hypothetical protein JO208_08385 [Alphaproteobacteria bacterium]|nr:hypothetical protein [Alphaproteobacteria bacterium]
MPKNVAQWTGPAVTAIIVFGCDKDVIYAMPLGVMAGALATLLVALDEQRGNFAVLRRLRRVPSGSASQSSP